MISEQFKRVLSIIACKLNNSQIPFVLIGSTNNLLHGMDVKPNDIDIAVAVDNLKKIEAIFREQIVQGFEQYKTKTVEPAWRVTAKISDVEVEFVGETDNGIYMKSFLANKYTTIKVDDLELLCLTLEAEMEADEAKGRYEKVAQVMKFIHRKTKSLKFHSSLMGCILDETKTTTWRLFDDKNLKVGDLLVFLNSETGKEFAYAKATIVTEKLFGELTEQDWEGHERFISDSEMYKTYSEYYKQPVDKNTLVKVIKFELFRKPKTI